MKRTIVIAVAIAMVLVIAGCSVEGNSPEGYVTEEEQTALDSYIGAFGHVRVLGDIDHIMKNDMDATMKLSAAMSFNETKTELTIPLALSDYDFDGHKNEEDPNPEKYTRLADGAVTLVLKGAMNAEGTGFVATGYEMRGVNVTLSVDTTEYILLNLPELEITAEALSGIFTTTGGVARSSVTVTVEDGKAVGIGDVNTPKFGTATGTFLVNGKAGAVL